MHITFAVVLVVVPILSGFVHFDLKWRPHVKLTVVRLKRGLWNLVAVFMAVFLLKISHLFFTYLIIPILDWALLGYAELLLKLIALFW